MKKILSVILGALAIILVSRQDTMSVVHASDLRERTIEIAVSEVGYLEKASLDELYDATANAGGNNYTKYAADVAAPNGQPWGAVFVWWVMQQAGVPSQAYPQMTTATTDWFRERELWKDREGYTPQPGDYAVLGEVSNCGIVEKVTTDSVTIIVGNRAETNAVTRYTTTLEDTYIKGYGIIDYDYVYEPTGVDLGEQFCATFLKTDVLKTIRNYGNRPVLWVEAERSDYRWLFTKQTDGTYVIQSLYDGKILAVQDGRNASNTDVILEDKTENNNASQKWYICESGKGYRFISQNATNYCLNVVDNNNADGTVMNIRPHHNGYEQMFSLNKIDYVKLTGITISSNYDATMYIGEQQTLNYSFVPANASSNTVTWSSSDATIAEVDENGTVTTKGIGSVTIVCKSTFDNAIVGQATIEVKAIPVEQDETTEENPVVKGTEIIGKECRFEVTNVKKQTVKVIGVSDKKDSNIKIPATVKYEGKAYKVTSVGKNAFKNNKKIKTVTIGNNVQLIQANAFRGCKQLKQVVIGKNVATIGKQAFYECSKLKKIKIKSTKLKKVGSKAFKKIDKNAIIYAPKKKMKKYQKLFKGKI